MAAEGPVRGRVATLSELLLESLRGVRGLADLLAELEGSGSVPASWGRPVVVFA